MKYSRLARHLALGTALAGIWGSTSFAADTANGTQQVGTVNEVVVTARRKEETLQNVPMTVTAVTAADLKQFNINNGADLESLAPGLQFRVVPGNDDLSIGIRGAGTQPGSAATATAQIYLNEAPIENHVAVVAYGSIYDTNQVEVLRGPQGTLRGLPASSGAITFTTTRPNLDSYGGSAGVTLNDHSQARVEAAVNLPIIKDVFAIRVAGVHDHNDNDGVQSVNDSQRPYQEIDSWRVSARFKPIDSLDINVMYEDYWSDFAFYDQVFGAGYQQATPGVGPASNYSGPAIGLKDRLAVEKQINHAQYFDRLLTANVAWDIAPHLRLTYVGSYFQFQPHNVLGGDADIGNFYPVPVQGEDFKSPSSYVTQEVRLESAGNRFWDWGVGAYYEHYTDVSYINEVAEYLPGDFGNPGLSLLHLPAAQSYNKFNPYYAGVLDLAVPTKSTTAAIYANTTIHVTPSTELFAGVRYQDYTFASLQTGVLTGPVNTGLPSSLCFLAPGAVKSTVIPGTCDLPLNIALNTPQSQQAHPLVYQASLTQHFGQNISAYVSYGHSWRASVPNFNINSTDPRLLAPSKDETSDNYEIGVKSAWLNRTLVVNVAVFDQKFQNYQVEALAPYVDNLTPSSPTVTPLGAFNINGNAEVKGFDVDVFYRPSRQFFVNASVNYAQGRLTNASLPCSDSNGDGIADGGVVTLASFAPGQSLNYCKSNESLGNQPDWGANLTAEYNFPVNDEADAYIRTLSNYTPQNNFALTNFVSKGYGIVDLFAGLRSHKAHWDFGVYGRNIFDTQVQLIQGSGQIPTPTNAAGVPGVSATSGYTMGTLTQRREIGITGRYSF